PAKAFVMLVYPHEILQNHFPQRRGNECAEYVVWLSQATSPRSGFVQPIIQAGRAKARPLIKTLAP
ncbi:MAG: hypothetical protein Q8J94_04135, partial [Thiobacillus sp.]|nr:hypothetical protein [Thiobacillus sp.]